MEEKEPIKHIFKMTINTITDSGEQLITTFQALEPCRNKQDIFDSLEKNSIRLKEVVNKRLE